MSAINVSGRSIGPEFPPYMVAELSGNHAQDIEQAKALIAAAAEAGADAVKLQTYTPDTITLPVRSSLFEVKEGLWKGRYLHDLYAEAMTPWEWHGALAEFSKSVGLPLFSTPFDESAVEFLEREIDPPLYKIASFELNHVPLLECVGRLGKPVVLSTGMAEEYEIETAVRTLRTAGAQDIILLKCVSAYPAKPEDFNLRGMVSLKERFEVDVGLSDHSLTHEIALGATVLGAVLIEKHLVMDRNGVGIDKGFSLEPDEFAEMVAMVKRLHAGMGKSGFGAAAQDQKQKRFRRSIFVSKKVLQGEMLTAENLKIVRPSDGLEPAHWKRVLGAKATRDLDAGTPLDDSHFT